MGKRVAARDLRAGMSAKSTRTNDPHGAPDSPPLVATGRLRRAVSLHTATALAGGLLATLAVASPAVGQTTRGGAGGQGNAAGAPVGGVTSVTGAGGAGSNAAESYEGGAGGGAGVTGGKGGDAFTGAPGGAGGASAGASGSDGQGGSRASGGGGGAHGAYLPGAPGTAVAGGNGGAGGSSADGDGGGGGAGGYGAVATGSGTMIFNHAITGGNGGAGGGGYFYGGSGGDGGHGLVLTGTGAALSVNGAIAGGNGGVGGGIGAVCCLVGSAGAGGAGIVGGDVTLTLRNTVSGGLSGDGVTRADAISFTGGANTLNLDTGWGLVGGIRAEGTVAINPLVGSATLGNTISGTGSIRTSGALTLSGANSYTGGTEVASGTLLLGHLTAAGTGTIWLRNGATLHNLLTGGTPFYANAIRIDAGESATLNGGPITGVAYTGAITGGGDLVVTGNVALMGTNSYGATTINAGSQLLAGYLFTGGTLGTGNVTNYGILAFGRSDSVTVSNVISGSGEVRTRNGGVVILTGNNDYTGITTISPGTTIQVGNGGLTGALGTGNVDNSGSLVFNRADDITVANNISGFLGTLTKQGAGTLTLTGGNSYGGITTISAGTLQIGNGGTTGTLGNGHVTNDAALAFNRSDDIAFTYAISGSGSLTKLGAGTLTLSGNNSYGGGTTINAGKLVRGSAGALGTGLVTIDGGTLDLGSFDMSLDRLAWFDGGIVSSGGGLSIADGLSATIGSVGGFISTDVPLLVEGTLTVLGDNDLSGGIILDGHLLLGAGTPIGAGGTIHTIGSVITYADGTDEAAGILLDSDTTQLEVLGTDIATQSGAISETGGSRPLEKIGSGTLILTGSNSYSGGTFVLDGTLALGEDDSAGTGAIALADGTRLLTASCGCDPLTIGNDIEVAVGGAATIDTDGYETWLTGTISGGDVTFADTFGGGLTVLTGDNTYGATTIESSAEVQVGDGGTTGTLGTGNVLNDGVLVFDRSDDVTFSQEIGGTGLLVQAGDGTLTLTGTNTYTGGTVIDGGTLRVGDGGTTGTLGTGDIDNYGTLIFDRSDDITVADDIYGDGDLTKLGAGTLTLTGFNSYGGTTSVQGGTLAITTFALGSSLVTELGNGATLRTLEDAYAGNLRILPTGGTIDTGAFTFDVIAGVDFQGLLTKTGTGRLILEDIFEEGTGDGGIKVMAGTLGLANEYAAGTGRIWLADGTTLLNAACLCGDLTINNDIEIADGGTATFDAAGQGPFPTMVTLNGNISGGNIHYISPDYVEAGTSYAQPAVFVLNGANTYGQTLIAPNIAVILADGTLGTGNVVFDSAPSDPMFPAALVFSNSADYTFGGAIVGDGLVAVQTFDPETTITLSGSNTASANFTGTIEVENGRLAIDGNFGDVVGNTAELFLGGCGCGAEPSLGGSGTFYGNVELGDAALDPGNSPGTLNIAGNLTLGAGTILNYELGASGTVGGPNNDLITVGGNLTLDGTLNTIAWGAGYGPGYYRLFNYAGTLTDNTLDIGAIAGGLSAEVLSNIGGQINVRLGPQVDLYWDGTDTTGASTVTGGNGGSGTWSAAGTNWTAASGFGINDQWRSVVGVFAGATAGTVTVEGTQAFEGLRFETDGYLLQPFDVNARLQTTGTASIVDVDLGLAADIGVIVQGGAGLTKTGFGTLVLSAVNTYGGATTVSEGTLRLGINGAISNQSALDVAAGATFDLDGFHTQVGSIAGAGAVTLNNGQLDTGFDGTSTTFSGTVTGPDGGVSVFTKNGSGTLTLSGSIALGDGAGVLNSFGQVNDGTLDVTATGSLAADLVENFSTITNAGTITGGVAFQNFGTITNNATGTIVGTTQNFGTLDNNGGTMGALQSLGGTATSSGTINGSVQSFTSFTSTGIINGSLSNFSTALIEGQLNGEAGNFQPGAAITLTGITTGITNYQGVAGATLDLANFSTTVGALNGNGSILIGTATLTVDSLSPIAAFGGGISGSGGLVKTGGGEQTLTGVNTFGGLTTVSGGGLIVDFGGSLAGAVLNGATFHNIGTINGLLTNQGTAMNGGTLAGGAINTGTLSSTGTISIGLENSGLTSLAGTIDGFLTNSDRVALVGALTGVTTFTQSAAGTLNLGSYEMTAQTLTGAGTIQGSISSLTLTGNASSTFSGTFIDIVDLIKNGTGTLTLTGNSTRAGTTMINAGTLQVGTGGATGALGSGAIVNDGALVVDRTGTVTLDGPISGGGTLTNAGTGTLILLGDNSYSGTTTISNGTLQIGDGGTTGSLGSGDVANDGTLEFNRSGVVVASGVISGSGNLITSGSGTLYLSGNNTYTGTTTIGAGSTLGIGLSGVGSVAGSLGSGTVFNDGLIEFNRADPITVANTITGSGVLRIPGGDGDVTLTAANSYTGGTQVMGTLRLGNDSAAGTGTIGLAGTLASTLSFGTLTLANDINVEPAMPGRFLGADFGAMVLNGSISGDHATFVSESGAPTIFQLNGANSYGDTYIGAGASVVMNSTLGTGDIVVGATAGPVPAELYFRNTGNYAVGGTISGTGTVWFSGVDGTTMTLSGDNTSAANFTGTALLNAGNLVIDGDFGDVVGNTASLVVFPNAFAPPSIISGSGTFHGNLDAQAGGVFNPGNSPGTLTIGGDLILGAGTILNYELGGSGTPGGLNNDLMVVGGNLTLDGTLNTIAFGTGYEAGYYRLFDYGGTLTDNGLTIGTIDGALSASVLTNIAGQVNVVLGAQLVQYWDGGDVTGASATVDGDGGSGIWTSASTNWTAAAGFGINDEWRGQIGVFAGAAGGTVNIVGMQDFQELRFQTDGYVLAGGAGDGIATTAGFSVIDIVGGVGTEIQAGISGAAGLTKTGAGTLTLSGINTYTGLTIVNEGVVELTAGAILTGDVQNDATFTTAGFIGGGLVNNGTVSASGSINGSIVNNGNISLSGNLTDVGDFTQAAVGRLTLNGMDLSIESLAGAGTIDLGGGELYTNTGTNSQFDGAIVGPGTLAKNGAGTLTLGGDSTAGFVVLGGTLVLTGSTTLDVVNYANFTNSGTVGGNVQNWGGGTALNDGTIVGSVDNYGTFTSSGTIGNGLVNQGGATAASSGTITGDVFNSGGATFASTGTIDGNLDNYGSTSLAGLLNGNISNQGDIVLTGTTVGIGLLNQRLGTGMFDLAGFDTTLGSLIGDGEVRLGTALLTVGGDDSSQQFNGVITGAGSVTKVGAGVMWLYGANTYTGLTTISGGTLFLSTTGTLAGDVQNDATFENDGIVGGLLTNSSRASNEGTLNGGVANSGLFNTYGTINGNLVNSGTVYAEGALNGAITNDGYVQLIGSLSGVTAVTQGAHGTLIIGDETFAVGALNGAGHVELGGGLLEIGSSGANSLFDGEIYGDGALTKVGAGTLTLTGWNSYTGTTTILAGTLRNTGTLSGPVLNRATFASTGVVNGDLDNLFGSVMLEGQLNGSIENYGDITLTGTTTGIGEVFLSDLATLDLNGFDTTVGSVAGPGSIQLGSATLTTGGNNLSTSIAGIVAGTGGLTKVGTGELILFAANTYTGLTTISGGSIYLDTGAALVGAVQNDAGFYNRGTVAGLLTNAGSATNLGSLNGGVDNSGTLDTLGIINGNVVNTGAVHAAGVLIGAVVNDGSFTLTGFLSGVTDFTQSTTGLLDLNDENFTVGALAGAGVVQLGSGVLTVGGSGADTEFAGEIAGSGNLAKIGIGTLTLSGVNSFTGLTSVNAGALLNSGVLSGPVVNYATFTSTGVVNGDLANSGTASVSGQLNGTVGNAGALALTGVTTGIGWFSQSPAGTFALNGFDTTIGSLSGEGQVQLGSATLTTDGDSSRTFDGVISGSGGLTKVGTGTLQLRGANTFTGTTTVTAGALLNEGSLAGPVANQATFTSTGVVDGDLTNGGTANLAGQLNGAVANSGTVNLTGATTGIGGFSQTAAGTFALNGFGTTIGSLAGGGLVQLGSATLTTGGDNSSTAFAGVVSGTGALTKAGTGTLVLGGANTFTGATTITGGTLQLGSGGAGGSLASSSIVNNGVLAINRSELLQLSAAISGTGSLVQAGSSTTLLTGANTYTGGTLVSGGRLTGSTSSLQGAIEANAVVEFAQANAGTYAGALSGAGAMEKTGLGRLTLTGDSSTFTGATRVLGGELVVNGLLDRSVVTVGAGATLLGTGPIGGLIAQGGSFVAPGNSIGTLVVAGNVQLLPGSTYQAEITSTDVDLITATGTAQVAGTLAVINLGGTYTLGTTYVLLDAEGGRSGTFDAATGLNSFGTKLRGRIVYTPTQVQLLIANNSLTEIACAAPTRNQAGFLAAFDDAVQNGGFNPEALEALYNLDPAGACAAIDQVSGGVYPAAASVALEDERLVREAAIDRLRSMQDSEAGGTGIWGQLVGAWGHVNSGGTGFDVDNHREGAIVGVDTGGAGWRVGLYGHHIQTELDADALASEAHIDRTGFGAYAGFTSGSFRARFGASYSDLELSTTRTIAFPGFSATTQGRGDGSMVQGFGELAYRFDLGDDTFLEPFADLALATVDLDAIDESGSAAAQLRVAEQEHDVGRAIAGLRGDAAVQSGSTRLRIGIDAGLQHNFGDRDIAALIALDGAPQHPFTMRGAALEPWSFVGGGRVAIDFGSNVTATVSYRGVLAGNSNDHAASGTLSVRF